MKYLAALLLIAFTFSFALAQKDSLADVPPSRILNLNHSDIYGWLVAFKDVDFDGDKDLVTNDHERIVCFYNRHNHLGNSVGIIDTLDSSPSFLEIVDIDGDGGEDILFATRTYLGFISDTFMLVNRLFAGRYDHAVVADFNGDDRPDIVAVSQVSDTFMVAFKLPGGGYNPTLIATHVGSTNFILPVDLNGDNDLDLVLNGTGVSGKQVWQNDGNGNFSSKAKIKGPFSTTEPLFLSDVDNNGKLDIMFYDLSGPSPDYWRFQVDSIPGDTSTFDHDLLVQGVTGPGLHLDFDGNGYEDLLAFNKVQRRAYFVEDMTFPTPQEDRTDTLGPRINYSRVGFEQFPPSSQTQLDEEMPVITWGVQNNRTASYLGAHYSEDYTQNFDFIERPIAFRPEELKQVEMADLDGDGDLDLIATDAGRSNSIEGHKLFAYENVDGTHFMPWTLAHSLRGVNAIATADVDGDQDIDILVSTLEKQEVILLKNPGNGNFYHWEMKVKKDSIGEVTNIILNDFEKDGKVDAVWCSPENNRLFWLPDVGDEVLSFGAIINTTLEEPQVMATGDFNKDGWTDLAVAGDYPSGDGSIALYYNDPNAHRFTEEIIFSGKEAHALVVGDWDGDGWDDLIAGFSFPFGTVGDIPLIMSFEFGPQGFYISDTFMLGKNSISALALADLNDDNAPELVFALDDGNYPGIQVWGDPHIDLFPANLLNWIPDLAVGDCNGDGVDEVFAVNPRLHQMLLMFPDKNDFPVDTTRTTAVSEKAPVLPIKVYPNPVVDNLFIELPFMEKAQLIVLDILGKEMMRERVPAGVLHWELPVHDLSEGVYFLEVRGEEGMGTVKFVKE